MNKDIKDTTRFYNKPSREMAITKAINKDEDNDLIDTSLLNMDVIRNINDYELDNLDNINPLNINSYRKLRKDRNNQLNELLSAMFGEKEEEAINAFNSIFERDNLKIDKRKQ